MIRQFSALILITFALILTVKSQPTQSFQRGITDSHGSVDHLENGHLVKLANFGPELKDKREVTESQKQEVAKNEAYRQKLDKINAQWQKDSLEKLKKGQQPDPFPSVPPPDLTAPTAA